MTDSRSQPTTETPTSPSVDALRHAFRAADDIDWAHLDQFIPHSGHGKFWRAVFKEVRAALTRPAPSSPALDPVTVERRLIAAKCTSPDGTYVHASTKSVVEALIGQPAPSSTVEELDQGNASVASPSNGHPGSVEAFKWLDPECGVKGCQSLVWKGRYESAVNGRREFRQAYRETRSVEAPVAGETKLVYVKRWRTLVSLPAAYADEIRDALASPPPPDTAVRAALEEAVTILRRRAAGYESRATSIFNGRIMADELKGNAREIEALADRLAALPPDAGSRT